MKLQLTIGNVTYKVLCWTEAPLGVPEEISGCFLLEGPGPFCYFTRQLFWNHPGGSPGELLSEGRTIFRIKVEFPRRLEEAFDLIQEGFGTIWVRYAEQLGGQNDSHR